MLIGTMQQTTCGGNQCLGVNAKGDSRREVDSIAVLRVIKSLNAKNTSIRRYGHLRGKLRPPESFGKKYFRESGGH